MMEDNPDYWKHFLSECKARLEELDERGEDALSEYDKTISSSSPEEGLATAYLLIKSQISYAEKQLRKNGEDLTRWFK